MIRRPSHPQAGFTLMEMLVALAVAGIISGIAFITLVPLIRSWQVRSAANQVYDDLQRAQEMALKLGEYTLTGGRFIQNRVFVVFDTADGRYEVLSWSDDDADGKPDPGEESSQFTSRLPKGVAFGFAGSVDQGACGNAGGVPGDAVTFAVSNPADPPCNNQPCIRLNKFGFSEEGPGAVYVFRGDDSYAVSGSRAGNFDLCRWNGNSWQ